MRVVNAWLPRFYSFEKIDLKVSAISSSMSSVACAVSRSAPEVLSSQCFAASEWVRYMVVN